MWVPQPKKGRASGGEGMAVGLALGVAVGAAMDNVGVGIAIGVALGAAFGAGRRGRTVGGNQTGQDESDKRRRCHA